MKTLVIVDLQNDFMPEGALGVPKADEIIPIINRILPKFSLIIGTQDWHPSNHVSFSVNHPGKKPGNIVDIKGVSQILWPVHCVRNTPGAELVDTLYKERIEITFYKGTDQTIDSYSAFFDNAHGKSTGLHEYLTSRKIKEIYIVGLTTDYCVLYSVIDAIDLGFKVHVIADGCRAINLHPGDEKKAYAAMREKGASILTSKELMDSL